MHNLFLLLLRKFNRHSRSRQSTNNQPHPSDNERNTQQLPHIQQHSLLEHPLEILKVWEGGLASHGGAIGIIIAIWLYSRRVTHRNMLWTFDRLVVPVALVAALIRTGNLMNHEIYGHVTTLPWGFRFIQNLSEWMKGAAPIFTEPSHPTQIYEALCYLLLFGLLLYMYWKRNAEEREGLIFGTFLIGIFLRGAANNNPMHKTSNVPSERPKPSRLPHK